MEDVVKRGFYGYTLRHNRNANVGSMAEEFLMKFKTSDQLGTPALLPLQSPSSPLTFVAA
jgi:hypothetical protein